MTSTLSNHQTSHSKWSAAKAETDRNANYFYYTEKGGALANLPSAICVPAISCRC